MTETDSSLRCLRLESRGAEVSEGRVARARITSRALGCLLASAIALLALSAPAFGVVRAAFYEPVAAESWLQATPYSHYVPSLGAYDSGVDTIVQQQLVWMNYANLDAAIASWDGAGSPSDSRLPTILNASVSSPIKWSLYYEPETASDPSITGIAADLAYISGSYASQPSYLRIDGRPVLFVHGGTAETCDMADRWKQANTLNFYIVLTVVPGYTGCDPQPDAWHEYAPGVAESEVPGQSYSISPGRWTAGAAEPEFKRPTWPHFRGAIRRMVASNEPLQLVTTWNDWADGSAVEGATDWVHGSCVATSTPCTGTYLNLLHKHITSVAVAAAGDIACDPASASFNGGLGTVDACNQKSTAELLAGSDAVLGLGDLQYENATANKFAASYDPTWGAFKSITYPVPGNHEYNTPGATGYFDYFGARAGDPAKGYYSFDLGAWHLIALNSNCSVVSCAAGSEQETWLKADLALNATKCTLAYWHQAHFTDGPHTPDDDGSTGPFWDDLYAASAELVLNGHDHNYQRFARLKPDGTPDDAAGIREIIVGTGGKDHDSTPTPGTPAAELSHGGTFGVLKLWLWEDGFDWQFVHPKGAPSKWFDYGSEKCH
jgi:calcineurin-like phosphoesterase family protein